MKPTLASQAATRTEEDTDHRTRVGRERRERTQARIIDNDPYPRLYRKEMITVFLERSFEELDKN